MPTKITNEVEDIFSGESTPKKPFGRPPLPPPRQPKPPVPAVTPSPVAAEPARPRSRLMFVWLALFGVIVVGGGAVLAATGVLTKKQSNEPPPLNQGAKTVTPEPTNQSVAVPSVTTNAVPDTDGDGLTDDEEKSLGTNPTTGDSDADGLFDREEVKVYQTDPLKRDTDVDGVSDGDEVKAGSNPTGTGQLLNLEAGRQQLNK